MLLAEVAAASEADGATSGRSAKTATIAALVGRADPDEVGLVVRYLTGELRQRRTGLGYAALRDLPAPVEVASVTVADVDAVFEHVAGLSGRGSTRARRAAFAGLMAAATLQEQHC